VIVKADNAMVNVAMGGLCSRRSMTEFNRLQVIMKNANSAVKLKLNKEDSTLSMALKTGLLHMRRGYQDEALNFFHGLDGFVAIPGLRNWVVIPSACEGPVNEGFAPG